MALKNYVFMETLVFILQYNVLRYQAKISKFSGFLKHDIKHCNRINVSV